MRVALVVGMLAIGCASPEPVTSPRATASPRAVESEPAVAEAGRSPIPASPLGAVTPPGAPASFLAACREPCTRRQMMRAVAASLIEAECTQTCGEAWALPEVRSGGALAQHGGQAVRAFGRLRIREARSAVVLADGVEVPWRAADATGDGLVDGAAVVVVGTLEDGALTHVTVVAPGGP